VFESWAISGVFFLRLPRKSEIATGCREVERVRRSQARRERRGRQETDDQPTSLPLHCTPLFPFVSLLPSA